MQREQLEVIIEQKEYLSGGTKEACVKAREFLRYATVEEGVIKTRNSSVEAKEFIEAVKILMAASFFRKEDECPETWHCDVDCSKLTTHFFCQGECNVDKNSTKLCPFFEFEDEGFI